MQINGISRHVWRTWLCAVVLAASVISACTAAASVLPEAAAGADISIASSPTEVKSIMEDAEEIPFSEEPTKPIPTTDSSSAPTPGPEVQPEETVPLVWISPALPRALRDQLALPEGITATADRNAAALRLEIPTLEQWEARSGEDSRVHSYWVYALVAPFPTVQDDIRLRALQNAWTGRSLRETGGKPLLMTAETRGVLEQFWGPAEDSTVQVADAEALLDIAWEIGAWAIVPFEDIQPRWKVMRIESQSPLERDFVPERYPLVVPVWVNAAQVARSDGSGLFALPSNRDPYKLTTLVMTGVTALSRHIGERMESKGITYPAREIGPLLANADITHISNEVSFFNDCPTPGPGRLDMRFCSAPKYIALLDAVGTDIVELTGNHNLDWGVQPFLDSLAMYQERGWGVYGGGETQEAARRPLLVEHNGNRLAFLGCSPSGPENVWATSDRPGAASCDFALLEEQVRALRDEGILPVVTLQAVETDTYLPAVAQGMPLFRRLAQAGAVIVSGSQSHVPQTMTFVDSAGADSFVHYGLGNLFFDQMQPLAARQQFIDRHVFYDGKYLGVELVTTLLEDYARPRPMTNAERSAFLEKIFALCTWNDPQP